MALVSNYQARVISLRGGVEPVSSLISVHPAIEEAAGVIAAGKGGHALTQAKTALIDIKNSVETILGREPELLLRTSRSTGARHLSVVLAEGVPGPVYDMEPRGKELCQYLESKGIMAKRNQIVSGKHNMIRYVVDIPLDDKLLGFMPGVRTAAELAKDSISITRT